MKKVININFQGQVIAIEETAYEILNKYIGSLKKYFSREEGGDEIVNDIENRIAELFGNRLKLGINCITDEDVESIINSIGRPEDFDTDYVESEKKESEPFENTANEYSSESSSYESQKETKSLYRNSNDKILGGVCSGLAHYFKTDPVWLRLIFLIFFGFLFWVYIILWIVLKEKQLETNVAKKLYRNPTDRYIGGVCGGIAAYFKIDSWIPRLIFLLPLFINVFGIFSFFPLNHFFGNSGFDWHLNGGVVLLYFVLMAIIPEAKSVKQKLEMMGEEEYIRSIRDRVNDNLANTKNRADDNTSNYNSNLNAKDKTHIVEPYTDADSSHVTDSSPLADSSYVDSSHVDSEKMPPEPPYSEPLSDRTSYKSERSGCFNLVVVFIKVAFFSLVGIIGLAMLAVFAGLIFAGAQLIPLKSLLIDQGYESTLLMISLILLILVPIVAIITWIVRRVMKTKSRPVIGAIATTLWLIGVALSVILIVKVVDKFNVESSSETSVPIIAPTSNKLYVEMEPYKEDYADFKYKSGFGLENEIDKLPFTNIDGDSLLFRNVNMHIRQSVDSVFNVRLIFATSGKTLRQAKNDTEEFSYNIVQDDSILFLPEFLLVPVSQGFRNQSVTVEIAVPAGKSIEVSDALREYRNNEPPSVARKRIRSYSSSYTPYVPASLPETENNTLLH